MSCHGALRWDADGEVFGVLEEALAGGILAEAVGEAGHGVEPAPVDGERAHPVERRGLPIDGAGGCPGGAPGRCCTNRDWPARCPPTGSSPADAI